MLIGAMNHPREDVLAEIAWMAESGMDFVDLTIEPPAAASWTLDAAAIRRMLERHRLGVVGHTAYYLPIASPFEEIRQAAVVELARCLRLFSETGAKWMNIHPDRPAPMHDRSHCIERNLQSLDELLRVSETCGVGLMLENLPGSFNTPEELGELLGALPQVGLHLDIGHCNLRVPRNSATSLIAEYGSRIRHVHLHDNNGGHDDLHLPLGAGRIDAADCLRSLKQSGYDGTITLEVFTPDRSYLFHSRDRLREIWRDLDGAPSIQRREPRQMSPTACIDAVK